MTPQEGGGPGAGRGRLLVVGGGGEQVSVWPEQLKTREFYTRYEDMSPDGRLTIFIEEDGDVIVDVEGYDLFNQKVRVNVQFCTFGGGGMSMKTRQALLDLAVAILEDNHEKPQYKDPPP